MSASQGAGDMGRVDSSTQTELPKLRTYVDASTLTDHEKATKPVIREVLKTHHIKKCEDHMKNRDSVCHKSDCILSTTDIGFLQIFKHSDVSPQLLIHLVDHDLRNLRRVSRQFRETIDYTQSRMADSSKEKKIW